MNLVSNVRNPCSTVIFLTLLQLEPSPTIDIVDFEEEPQTPIMSNSNVADAHDWQSRANIAELELAIERKGLSREKRRTRRLQVEVNKHYETLTLSKQVANEAINQCQYLLNINSLLAQEIQRQRIAVETLEVVIQKICAQSQDGGVSRDTPSRQGIVPGTLRDKISNMALPPHLLLEDSDGKLYFLEGLRSVTEEKGSGTASKALLLFQETAGVAQNSRRITTQARLENFPR
ncbi:hypothetical protein B0J14DRAFT_598023 [Halenospora varia]|nr:hypothetical protein B0J14DRAFT_598023 [Halenospora varia]